MVRQHGDYVLVRQLNKHPWPAVIWPDNRLPRTVRDREPMGYFTVVLLIRRKPQFEYAIPIEMLDFEPFAPTGNQDPELTYAYDAVLDAMDSPLLSLDYWAQKMEDQDHPPFLPSPSLSDDLSIKYEPGDHDLEKAKGIGPSAYRGKVTVEPWAISSPSHNYKVKDESEDEDFKEAIRLSLSEVRTATKRPSSSSFLRGNSKRARPTPIPFLPWESGNHRRASNLAASYNAEGTAKPGPKKPQPQKDDYADEDLSKSKAMVKVYIGEGLTQQTFLIPKYEVDKRPSLSDPQIGCMQPMDDGTTHLDLPCFRKFSPENFRLVAEFLSTGKFGRPTVDPTNRDEYLDECISAWLIADRMVLEDLLDLVVVKIRETRPWHLQEVIPLAEMVYQEEGSALGAYAAMKEMTADAVAENFQDLAVAFGAAFFTPLDDLPELQRDVHRRLFERAEKRLNEG